MNSIDALTELHTRMQTAFTETQQAYYRHKAMEQKGLISPISELEHSLMSVRNTLEVIERLIRKEAKCSQPQ